MGISILIKPASGNCNLRCKYCFYRDSMAYRKNGVRGMMSEETSDNLIRKLFAAADKPVNIVFQGGEPLLAGIGFFESFIEKAEKYNRQNLPVSYSLQTNGTLIDEDYAAFFAKHGFLLGLSLDGTADIHNALRNNSYGAVLKNAEYLKKYHVEFNILTVVTKEIAEHTEQVYSHLKSLGFSYLQFIPCLDDFSGMPHGYSLTADSYGDFLVRLYRLWKQDLENQNYVSIQLFDNIFRRLNREPVDMCGLNGFCSMQTIVEADGTVYPCDFYCTDEYALGNINTDSWEQIFENPRLNTFLQNGKIRGKNCGICRFRMLCRGGCRREYQNGENKFCKSYQMLFAELTDSLM